MFKPTGEMPPYLKKSLGIIESFPQGIAARDISKKTNLAIPTVHASIHRLRQEYKCNIILKGPPNSQKYYLLKGKFKSSKRNHITQPYYRKKPSKKPTFRDSRFQTVFNLLIEAGSNGIHKGEVIKKLNLSTTKLQNALYRIRHSWGFQIKKVGPMYILLNPPEQTESDKTPAHVPAPINGHQHTTENMHRMFKKSYFRHRFLYTR